MAGDYTKFQRHYGPISLDVKVTGLISTTTTIFAVRNPSYQLYVQKAYFSPGVFTGALTAITLQDTTGYVITVWNLPTSDPLLGAETNWFDDYGPSGTPLTLGANLNMVVTPVGISGILHLEGYQRLAQVIGANSGAANQ